MKDQTDNAAKGDFITTKETSVYSSDQGKPYIVGTITKNKIYPYIVKNRNWYQVNFAGNIAFVKSDEVNKDVGIPVLMYHHILKDGDYEKMKELFTVISEQQFKQEMNFLNDQHYETITLPQLENYIEQKIVLPAKTVVLTFDDGLKSNIIYAYPILKQYGFHATIFSITGRTTKEPKPFNPSGLQFTSEKEMAQSKDVFAYESHTDSLHAYTHGVSKLLQLPYDEVVKDLKKSKAFLNVNYFAYPFGAYNDRVIKILKKTGFKMAFVVKNGRVKVGDDPYQLKRIFIGPKTSMSDFENLVKVQ